MWQSTCRDLNGCLSGWSFYVMAVVAVLSSGTSREGDLNILLHYLAFLAVRHSFSFTVPSFCGKANPVADALSCFQFQRFMLQAPLVEQYLTPIPPGLLTVSQVTWLMPVLPHTGLFPFESSCASVCPVLLCHFLPSGWPCGSRWGSFTCWWMLTYALCNILVQQPPSLIHQAVPQCHACPSEGQRPVQSPVNSLQLQRLLRGIRFLSL